jgi:hypothetical protein
LILSLHHHQVEMLVTLYVQAHCVEEVGSAGGSMGEVGACDPRVAKDAGEDTYTGHFLPKHQGGGDALVVLAAGEVDMDKLRLLVSVGMADEQVDAEHMVPEVADGVMR